nr:hypothetical protein [Tanacetum cinerariifolium]
MLKAFPLPVMNSHCQKTFPLLVKKGSPAEERDATAEEVCTANEDKAPKDDAATGSASEGSAKKKGRIVTVIIEDMQKRRNDAAILKTFGGNEATRKTKKNHLKQQYGNFKAEGKETLDQTFNRLQAIISHLEFMDVVIEQDDLNQNLLTSLAPEWLMHTIVWRNRSDLDTITKNSSGNGEDNTASIPTASTQVSLASANVVAASISLDTAYAYIAFQSNSSQIRYEDINQIDEYDIEEIDIKWSALTATRWASLLGSAGLPGAKTGVEGKTTNKSYMANEEENHALVADEEAPTEFALMAKSSSDNEVESKTNRIKNLTNELEMLKKEKQGLDSKLTGFQSASKDLENLIGSQRSEKNKEGLHEFTDDTITDYIRPSPSIESKPNDLQNNSSSVSENGESTSSILSMPEIKFVKAADSPTVIKTNKDEIVRKPSVKYTKMYRKTSKSSNVRGNKGKAVKASACWLWKPRYNSFEKGPNSNNGNSQNNIDDKGYWDSGCSRHMSGNISYLSDYKPYDGGYVSFRQGGFKITGKGTIKTDLTCLVAKASADECMLWHRRLGHLNKLVRHNLVRGLPSKCFKNDYTCVACLKGKQHKASSKTKLVNSVTKPLHTLHMDLFRPTSVSSLNHKWYCLVTTDDFSRFTWTFFLKTKDETSGILRNFITKIENLKDFKVKIIRCDNGGEFRNKEMNDFCSMKWIKREFSNARTPQQNGVAERTNRTLIKVARTMLADAKLPVTFWAEAVNTACKCEAKGDEGYFIGYSMSSKAFRVFNKRTKRVEENLHVDFLENKLIKKGAGPNWLFDIDTLTNSMNYVPVVSARTTSTNFSGSKEAASQDVKKDVSSLRYIALPNWFYKEHLESSTSNAQDAYKADAPESSGNFNLTATSTNPSADQMEILTVETPILTVSLPVPTACLDDSPQLSSDTRFISKRVTSQVDTPSLDNILTLSNRFEDILGVTTNTGDTNGVEADLRNMENNISASPTPTFRIYKDHLTSLIIGPVDTLVQTKTKSKEMEEQIFIAIIHQKTYPALFQFCLFSCFFSQEEPKKISDALKDPSWVEAMQEELLQFKSRMFGVWPIGTKWVLKNKKDERGIVIKNKARQVAQGHTQEEGIDYEEVFAPVARIEAIRLFLAYASFMGVTVYQMDLKSAFLYGTIDEEVYLCREFEALMHEKFQMSAMGELNFFLGLQVLQKKDGIFLSHDKYVGDILKKFRYSDVRSVNTPMDKENPWGKDGTGKDVDLHPYRSMIGSLMYLTASRPDIMFDVCACARHQVTPKECHLHAVKRIFRYLKSHPKLGIWYPKDSPFDQVAYSDSKYSGATQDRKSTTKELVSAGTISTNFSGTKEAASQDVKKDVSFLRYIALPNWFHEAYLETSTSNAQDACKADAPKSSGNSNPTATSTNPPADQIETITVETPIPTISSPVEAMQEELLQFKIQNVWSLVNYPEGVRPIGTKWVLKKKKDERGIVIKNKARLVAQGHTQEERIDYEDVFAPVARIEAIRLFLACASLMGFTVYQIDVKSAFLYGTINEEVYVMQPPRFQDPEFPARVYKVEKAMYRLHQAPRAWTVPLFPIMLVTMGKGSGTPIEPHHTPSPEAPQSPQHDLSSSIHPPITTATFPTVIPTKTPLLRKYTRRARIAQSSVLLTVADEPASPLGDDSQKLTNLCTRLQRQQDEMVSKITAQDLEISTLKARIKLLEDKNGGGNDPSREDATIKGRSLETGVEAGIERTSILTSGVQVSVPPAVEVATVSIPPAGEIPTVSVPTGSGGVPMLVPSLPLLLWLHPTQEGKLEEEMAKDAQRMNEQIDKEAKIARIHAEEELKMLIDGLDRNNETVAKYLQEYEQFAEDLSIGERIELINDLVKYQDNYAKVLKFKRKGIRLKQDSAKKVKTSEEVSKEDLKTMMQLVPVEEVYVEALQFVREDLNQLWALVKETLKIRQATSDKEKKLWVELKRLYEPDVEDQLWTQTQALIHDPVDNEFPLPEDFPTASEERFLLLRKRYATAKEACTDNKDK